MFGNRRQRRCPPAEHGRCPYRASCLVRIPGELRSTYRAGNGGDRRRGACADLGRAPDSKCRPLARRGLGADGETHVPHRGASPSL